MTEWTNRVKPIYLQYWIVSLGKLLGWDRARVVDWAKQFEDLLEDEGAMLYHEHPSYYITWLLVPEEQRSKLSAQALLELTGRIERALYVPNCTSESLSNYEWDLATQRINEILREAGG